MAISKVQGSVRYEADYDGIGEMLTADFMIADMRRRAEHGKSFAERMAQGVRDSGTYQASFVVDSGIQTSADGKRRAYGELSNTDDKSFVVEFGSGPDRPQGGSSPAHRILGKALDVMENSNDIGL